jgi:hypothetical protein
MYINLIDDLIDKVLDDLKIYCDKLQIFKKYNNDTNFVKYHNNILEIIKEFTDTKISKSKIMDIVKNESNYLYIYNTIKRYCAFYIYLGIAYYYKGGRELFITNIIESSKNQKGSTIDIPNFYNSENNSKLITFYNDIKNILSLIELGKTMDKIKIIIMTNPLKYDSTIKLISNLDEDYFIEYIIIPDNLHNILKTLIFIQIYKNEEKNNIIYFLNQENEANGEYKYIEVIQSNENKLIDFTLIQKCLTPSEIRRGLAEEIYDYLLEQKTHTEYITSENQEFINLLLTKKVLIPITEEFVRYHDSNMKYDVESSVDGVKIRDSTKIKYVVNKVNNVRNYHSQLLEKNPKLKLETEKIFYANQENRQSILYNENEEVNMINKIKMSGNVNDGDLLIDLENIRKYNYVNYKRMSKDGFKFRTTEPIQCIRYVNINRKKTNIELRMCNESLDISVVGLAWNPSNIALECFMTDDLINVNPENKNGYKLFANTIKKTFERDIPKIFYWLFNKHDKPLLDTYTENTELDPSKNIKIMISELYKLYINLVKNKYEKYISDVSEITIRDMNTLFNKYSNRYFDFTLNTDIKNLLIDKTLEKHLKDYAVEEDDVDSMIPGVRDKMIVLPVVKVEKDKKNIIKINEDESEDINITNQNILPICYHYVKWRHINQLAKLKSEEFSQTVVDFGKQYIKINKNGDYICKSCDEMLSLKKYIFEGTYIKESETFQTTNIAITQKLETIAKYSVFQRSIRNLEKNIEKIAYSTDLNSYIGSNPTIKLKRKMVIKDVIDIILLHTSYLKRQPKDRIENAVKKYNISSSFTNLFFFELKDDIFLTSSSDTDYYKIVKYNNIMIYLFLIILIELNPGQIINFKDDKRCNFFFYENVGKNLFTDLFIRLNQKDKTPLSKYPLLCYCIFYLSCVFTNNKIWLWNENNMNESDKKKLKTFTNINVQRNIIHTFVDLINTIVEANFEKDKNYMYEFLNQRFLNKLDTLFSDASLINLIRTRANKLITVDSNTKKITFTKNELEIVKLTDETLTETTYKTIDNNICVAKIVESEKLPTTIQASNFDILTICDKGTFHKWVFKDGNMNCTLCNNSYNDIVKLYSDSDINTSETNNNEILNKLILLNLYKLAKTYCITGDLHDFEKDKCLKCNKDKTFVPIEKELKTMKKNIEEKTYEINLDAFKKMSEHIRKSEQIKIETQKIMSSFNQDYNTKTDNKLYHYVSDFINILIDVLGNKIKTHDQTIYLKDNIYIIDHDYLGNSIKENIILFESDNKLEIQKDHPYFKCDILYYRDKSKNVYVYYDLVTLQYFGYSDNNKDFKKIKINCTLKTQLSIRSQIMLLGCENQYINLSHFNNDYITLSHDEIYKNTNDIVSKYFRTRINNLKQIIFRNLSIINNISNKGTHKMLYKTEENDIINEFTKKIKNINVSKNNDNIFKDWTIISNNIKLHKLPEKIDLLLSKDYVDVRPFNSMNNVDCKLIYYLIDGFSKLIEYNNTEGNILQKSEIAQLIIKLIQFSFNQYYRHNNDVSFRQFDFYLINNTASMDVNLQISGYYQELINTSDITDEMKSQEKEDKYTAEQENEALDIDDMDDDDDIEESVDALNGIEE